MIERGRTAAARALRSHWAVAAIVFALLAIVHTWPLATEPGTLSRNDNADTQLNEWILAWVAHQLPRDPLHLFEANIFYPAHDALAFSEPLIVPALMARPAQLVGASPVLVYNLVVIARIRAHGLRHLLLVDAWTGSLLAGLLAGSLFAFNTHTLTRFAHVQALHIYGLPLALLAIDRLVRPTGHRRGAAAGEGVDGLHVRLLRGVRRGDDRRSCCVRRAEWSAGSCRRQDVRAAARAAGVLRDPAGLSAVPAGGASSSTWCGRWPWSALLRDVHRLSRRAGRVHFSTWSGRFFTNPVDTFFPASSRSCCRSRRVVRRRARRQIRRERAWRSVAIGVAGVVLSLGPATPLYGWLFAVFPPMQGLRAAARFGNLFLLGSRCWPRSVSRTSDARGLGRRLGHRRAIAVVVLVNLESLRAPFEYRRCGHSRHLQAPGRRAGPGRTR